MLATKPYMTKTGRGLSDDDIESLADDVAGDIDVDTLKPRRRGRPPLEGGPADVVPVRLDSGLRAPSKLEESTDRQHEDHRDDRLRVRRSVDRLARMIA